MKKLTQKMYMDHLDECAPQDSNEWIIGGKLRFLYYQMGKYGEALKKFDPIAFRVGFNEWKRSNERPKASRERKDPEDKFWNDVATHNERFTDY